MKPKNTSSNVFCFEDLYNLVFVECGGNIDTSFPLSFVYFLEDMHLHLKRKIKKAKEKIPELEKELKALEEKYTGKVGRIQKTDKKRQKDKSPNERIKKRNKQEKSRNTKIQKTNKRR